MRRATWNSVLGALPNGCARNVMRSASEARAPMPAPPHSARLSRVDLDSFMERLREGLAVGHPDMPMFRFSREDARAFVLYLRSLQAPPAPRSECRERSAAES